VQQSKLRPNELSAITGHSLRDVRSILDANYLHRDPALGESAIRKLERVGEMAGDEGRRGQVLRLRRSKPKPMVKSADKPDSIHREPRQCEHAGESYFASTQRRARSYAKYSVFKIAGGQRRSSRSPALIG
jgi:hypothetical protein